MANFVDRKNVNNNWQGGKQDDYMVGGGGHDTIRGGGGNDRIYGDSGSDILSGEAGNDAIYGGVGGDTLDGGEGGDSLHGEDGNDSLSGGNGEDALTGGAGADLMTGGQGFDEFIYRSFSESVGSSTDTITDYTRTSGDPNLTDTIVIMNGDANAAMAGLQAWTFVEGSVPAGQFPGDGTGQATLVSADGYTTLTLYNNDGNLDPDFQVRLQGYYDETNFQLTVFDMAKAGTPEAFQDAIIFG